MLTEVFIVRHGETDNNVKHRFIGSTDMPLNERGLRQAATLREPMSRIALDRIYASPYIRTMQTAREVRGDRDIEIIGERGLCEIHCGEWEGLDRAEIERRWPGQIELWQHEPDRLRMAGGETLQQVQDRAVDAFARIVTKEMGGRVAVVSHMLTIQLVVARLFGVPNRDVWRMNRLENASITQMSVWDNGDFQIVKWGDDSHLPAELRNEYVRIAGFVQKDFRPAYSVDDLKGKRHFGAFVR